MTAGVEVNQDSIIVNAAPILTWARGKHISRLENWVTGKDGEIEKVD